MPTEVGTPKIDTRPDQIYMGIRTIAPFQGMFAVVDQLRREMNKWIKENQIILAGPPFLRYHVIDMRGEMDISYGVPVSEILPGVGRITAGILPGGRFASLIYKGNGLTGNKALIEWVRSREDIAFDRWDTEQGDNFRCRYESYLTDPKIEHRKTKWEVEVAIKLKD